VNDVHEIEFSFPKFLVIDERGEVKELWLKVLNLYSKGVLPIVVGSDVGDAINEFSIAFPYNTERLSRAIVTV
jgi:hypothetical protein